MRNREQERRRAARMEARGDGSLESESRKTEEERGRRREVATGSRQTGPSFEPNCLMKSGT